MISSGGAPLEKSFLITGHPRSGTGFMSVLMELAGYDVGHETMGEHGISSWVFTVEGQYQWWVDTSLRSDDYSFTNLICAVRDPVATVSSVFFTEVMSLPLRAQYIDFSDCMNPVDQAVKSVIEWYRIILSWEPDVIVRIENPLDLFQWLYAKGYTDTLIDEYPAVKVNKREHNELMLSDILGALPEKRRKDFQEHVDRFGYVMPIRI